MLNLPQSRAVEPIECLGMGAAEEENPRCGCCFGDLTHALNPVLRYCGTAVLRYCGTLQPALGPHPCNLLAADLTGVQPLPSSLGTVTAATHWQLADDRQHEPHCLRLLAIALCAELPTKQRSSPQNPSGHMRAPDITKLTNTSPDIDPGSLAP